MPRILGVCFIGGSAFQVYWLFASSQALNWISGVAVILKLAAIALTVFWLTRPNQLLAMWFALTTFIIGSWFLGRDRCFLDIVYLSFLLWATWSDAIERSVREMLGNKEQDFDDEQ